MKRNDTPKASDVWQWFPMARRGAVCLHRLEERSVNDPNSTVRWTSMSRNAIQHKVGINSEGGDLFHDGLKHLS